MLSWLRRRRAAAVGLVALVAALACVLAVARASRESQAERVARTMKSYVESSPRDRARAKPFGPLERVTCRPLEDAKRYRGEEVFLCGIRYESGATIIRCAALSGDVLHTSRDDPDVPCTPRIGVPADRIRDG